MTDFVLQKNVGALITNRPAMAPVVITAGTGANGAAVTPIVIQRSLIGVPMNARFAILWQAVLAATKTLSIATVKVRDSADGTTFADFKTFTDPGVVASATGTTNGQTVFDVDLTGARDYVEFIFTPTLSNTATDTVALAVDAVFAGADRLPAAA